MKRRAAFTLLEIVVAITIALMILMMAIPSVRGVMAEQALEKSYHQFDELVMRAQTRSVTERRTYALVWGKGEIVLVAMDKMDNDAPVEPEHYAVGEDEEYILERPAAMVKDPPGLWTFWRSGACEPALVTYNGPRGSWTVRYDALSARRTMLKEKIL